VEDAHRDPRRGRERGAKGTFTGMQPAPGQPSADLNEGLQVLGHLVLGEPGLPEVLEPLLRRQAGQGSVQGCEHHEEVV
jgi:hypothetical protein